MPTLHIDHAISDLALWRGAFDPLHDTRRRAGLTNVLFRQQNDYPDPALINLAFDKIDN